MTLFGAKMSNSASEPIDLDVTDASKRPQWTLPPRPAMPKTTDPEMIGWEFRDNLKTYVVEEKHASKRGNTASSKWPSTISASQLQAVRLSGLSAVANIQSLTTEAA